MTSSGCWRSASTGWWRGLLEREFIRDTFGKYVSADVAKAILGGEGQSPADWARRGRAGGGRVTGRVGDATVMFTDIENFSELAGVMEPAEVMEMLNAYFTLLAGPIQTYRGTINNFIGDAILTTFNLPAADIHHAENAGALCPGDPAAAGKRATAGRSHPAHPHRHQYRPGGGRVARPPGPADLYGAWRRGERGGQAGIPQQAIRQPGPGQRRHQGPGAARASISGRWERFR